MEIISENFIEQFSYKILETYLSKGLHIENVLFPESSKSIMEKSYKNDILPTNYSKDGTVSFYIQVLKFSPELAIKFKKEVEDLLNLSTNTPPPVKVYYTIY